MTYLRLAALLISTALPVSALPVSALPVSAQTPIAVQNPSFEAPFTPTSSGSAPCGTQTQGPVPGWNFSNGGYVFRWTGCTASQNTNGTQPPSDGYAYAEVQNSTISQDLGVSVSTGTYRLKFSVASWFYSYPGHYTASIGMGTTPLCTTSGYAPGEFNEITLICEVPYYIAHYNGFNFPPGNLTISLSADGWTLLFDSVSLTLDNGASTLPSSAPISISLSNCGLSTCTFTFPMIAPPTCVNPDGTLPPMSACSLGIQLLIPTVNCKPNTSDSSGASVICSLGTQAEIDITKTYAPGTPPTPQTLTVPVVKAASP